MVAMPVLYPLHTHAKLTALTVTTFLAVSGAGRAGTVELESELRTLLDGDFSNLITQTRNDEPAPGALFPAMVACNVVPQAGDMLLDGSGANVEERKLEFESRKILEIPALDVDVTCVRVPVVTGHSLSLVATFARPVSTSQATAILASAPGVAHDDLPTPLKATGRDVTLVGRIRQSAQDPCRLSLFVSGDNLRKGAALNAVQIAEYLRLG
jgi:aspartate-semialdehyde dehydrogenase